LTRAICVITGTRAEYGILFGLMKAIDADPALELQTLITGSHLDPRRGMTVNTIKSDGFSVSAWVDIVEALDDPNSIAHAAGRCLSGVAEALNRLRPDIVVLVGDRYEAMASAQASTIQNIPLAHIHGGEVTEGAFDDCLRHAISKLAHLHFVAAGAYRDRVIQLGEAPDRVYTVGAPGLDTIDGTNLLGAAELSKRLDFNQGEKFFLLTYHPETRAKQNLAQLETSLFSALDAFPDYRIIITGVNTDPGRDVISDMLGTFVAERPGRATMRESLGQLGYLSAMKLAAAVIGNSSSGIIEAPTLNTPTVNIGDRQKGRLMASSIVTCPLRTGAITEAISTCLDEDFIATIPDQFRPYGASGASVKIKCILKEVNLSGLTIKKFHDLSHEEPLA